MGAGHDSELWPSCPSHGRAKPAPEPVQEPGAPPEVATRAADALQPAVSSSTGTEDRPTYGLAESLRLYRLHAEGFDAEALRRDLACRDLACWCRLGQPCHVDVLLELPNP